MLYKNIHNEFSRLVEPHSEDVDWVSELDADDDETAPPRLAEPPTEPDDDEDYDEDVIEDDEDEDDEDDESDEDSDED